METELEKLEAEALKLTPNDVNVSTDLGVSYYYTNQPDKALEQFAHSLKLDGTETYDLTGFATGITPRQDLTLTIHRVSGETERALVKLRIDTPIEVDYYLHGGILPYVLRQLISQS